MIICAVTVCLLCATVTVAHAEEIDYYVCLSSQNYAVRNANCMEYIDGEYVLRNIALSSAVDFYVTDNAGRRWYAQDNEPMRVDESDEMRYDVLFSPETPYENGSHLSYRYYLPASYEIMIADVSVPLSYNPFYTAYEQYYVSSIAIAAGSAVTYGEETHVIARNGYYRILFTPAKTTNGNTYLFDENGNYGSGDDYVYNLYIEDAPQYYAVFDNVTIANFDAEIDGAPACYLSRYENNVAAAEYRSSQVFAPQRDYGIKYRVYEKQYDGAFALVDDDNNEDTAISKTTVSDTGWYVLSLTDIGDRYQSAFVRQDKDFGGWYLAGDFNRYGYDDAGNIDLYDEYRFVEVESDDEDYNEDYTQYVAHLTITEKQLQSGDVEFYITDGATQYKDGTRYIALSLAGTYKIVCSEEHTYGNGRHFRYILQDKSQSSRELLIGTAQDFVTFAQNCTRSADYSIGLSVYLTADIEFNNVDFVPVGTFSGTFYGGYHKLQHITYANDDKATYVFERLTYTASVERLTIESVTLGDNDADGVAVIGTNYGSIYALSVSGTITGKSNVAGIVATNGSSDTDTGDSADTVNKATVMDCHNSASIVGETLVGGICASNSGEIGGCINQGPVSGNKTHSSATVAQIGGIAGYSYGKIYDCTNLCTVAGGDSSQYVGGIAGLCVGEIYYSDNKASVSADKYAGGIVGYYGLLPTENTATGGIVDAPDNDEQQPVNSHTLLNYNSNYGDCTANGYVGGIVGNAASLGERAGVARVLHIRNCASVGNIKATAGSYVGGIAGNAAGVTITGCLSGGTLQAKGLNGGMYVGGIVGYGGDIFYCGTSATVKGADQVGGIAGYASSALQGCYANALLLPDDGAQSIGGIAGACADYDAAGNCFTAICGNYYIGNLGGISGTDYASAYDYAATAIASDILAESGTLSPILCEAFDREHWQAGQEERSYPLARYFSEAEDCTEFDDDELFVKLFDAHAAALHDISRDIARLTYTVTFMEWNKDNGDLYDEDVLQTDHFDIVSVVRVVEGQNAACPALIYAEPNERGLYLYQGDSACYFVSFPAVSAVTDNQTVYACYREVITSVTDPDNRVFAEGQFVKGTQVTTQQIGEYVSPVFAIDGQSVTTGDITLKYYVGNDANQFVVLDTDGHVIDSTVSGAYLSFRWTDGLYFRVQQQSAATLPYWAWLLIGVGSTLGAIALAIVIVLIVKHCKKRKTQA